jgi:hypothetical protein
MMELLLHSVGGTGFQKDRQPNRFLAFPKALEDDGEIGVDKYDRCRFGKVLDVSFEVCLPNRFGRKITEKGESAVQKSFVPQNRLVVSEMLPEEFELYSLLHEPVKEAIPKRNGDGISTDHIIYEIHEGHMLDRKRMPFGQRVLYAENRIPKGLGKPFEEAFHQTDLSSGQATPESVFPLFNGGKIPQKDI